MHIIKYNKPAKNWREALPLGNGLTGFNGFDKMPETNRNTVKQKCKALLNSVSKDYDTLKAQHIDDYSSLYNNQSISFNCDEDTTADLLLKAVKSGDDEKALDCLMSHSFHPWEGGEGKAPAQYVAALCTLAKAEIEKNEPEKAIALLNRTFEYPHNLGEGKLYGAQENLQNYLLGLAYEKLSNSEKATEYFEKASTGLSEPQSAMYYNDQPPETIFCQGLALLKLGKTDEANIRFNKLISYADEHMNDNVKIDYFAANVYSKIAVPPNSNSLN